MHCVRLREFGALAEGARRDELRPLWARFGNWSTCTLQTNSLYRESSVRGSRVRRVRGAALTTPSLCNMSAEMVLAQCVATGFHTRRASPLAMVR